MSPTDVPSISLQPIDSGRGDPASIQYKLGGDAMPMSFELDPPTSVGRPHISPRQPIASSRIRSACKEFKPVDSRNRVSVSQGEWGASEVRSAWSSLIARSSDAGVLEKSPEFLDHLLSTDDPSRFHLATVRDAAGSILGVVPLRVMRSSLTFEVSARVLARGWSRELRILGSIPLLPADPVVHDALFTALDRGFEDCQAIAMHGVPTASFLWHHVHASRYLRERFLTYAMYGVRDCHVIPLPEAIDDYWTKFSAKRRYNLRRQARMLREHFGGRLALRRFDSPQQVGDLIDVIGRTAECHGLSQWNTQSFRLDRREVESLADRGLLLIYVLMGAGRPCAALVGRKYQGVYYLEQIPRDRGLDRFSPGATAVQLAIEDLIRHTPIRKIDMGFGTPAYRHCSTNATELRASLFLLRRTLANRLLRRSHVTFNFLVDRSKELLRKPASHCAL
jgi:CelD/BcsL family acetyltransferase involved in cellulose biosynthesis